MATLTAPTATTLPQLPVALPKVDHTHTCPDSGALVPCFVGEDCDWTGNCGGDCTGLGDGSELTAEIVREATRYTY